MPKVFTSKTQKIGEIGEHLAVRYLESKGYKILERNYTRKWGEIDIVCIKGEVVRFCEVKSKTTDFGDKIGVDSYRAEDGMHPWKQKRLARTIDTYIAERKVEGEYQVDLIVVKLSQDMKEARIDIVENISL